MNLLRCQYIRSFLFISRFYVLSEENLVVRFRIIKAIFSICYQKRPFLTGHQFILYLHSHYKYINCAFLFSYVGAYSTFWYKFLYNTLTYFLKAVQRCAVCVQEVGQCQRSRLWLRWLRKLSTPVMNCHSLWPTTDSSVLIPSGILDRQSQKYDRYILFLGCIECARFFHSMLCLPVCLSICL